MRKIEEEMLKAFKERREWRCRNTTIKLIGDFVCVYLYGYLIAMKNINNEVKYSLAQHNTYTTRSRLRALGCNVTSKKNTPYRDGKVWYGDF